MIVKAKELHGNKSNADWFSNLNSDFKTDYVISSGIFNVRQGTNDKDWKVYIFETLNHINSIASKINLM